MRWAWRCRHEWGPAERRRTRVSLARVDNGKQYFDLSMTTTVRYCAKCGKSQPVPHRATT